MIMVKDSNTRTAFTLTKEQNKELNDLANELKVSKSLIVGSLLSFALGYKAGDALGEWLVASLATAEKPRGRGRKKDR